MHACIYMYTYMYIYIYIYKYILYIYKYILYIYTRLLLELNFLDIYKFFAVKETLMLLFSK